MSAFLTGRCRQAPHSVPVVVSTAWVTLLYVVGLAGGCRPPQALVGSDWRASLWGGLRLPLWVNNSRKHGDQFPAALPLKAAVNRRARNRLLCAMCGRLRVGKGFFERYRTAGRSCHVFGLLMRHCSWPLAIMLSADRVPVKSTRFKWRSGTCGLS